MRRKIFSAALLVAFAAVAAVANFTMRDWDKIRLIDVGMTEAEVKRVWGEPYKVYVVKKFEMGPTLGTTWVYESRISWTPNRFISVVYLYVRFDADGKVRSGCVERVINTEVVDRLELF
jgi:hypothetical protein